MKTISKIIALLVPFVLAVPATAGVVVTDSVRSSILGEEVQYNVYLPEGYDHCEHYPVIYLLHGLSDTYTAWMDKGNMKLVADELMASGECVPAVIVMPNAGGPDVIHTWNGYFNMPGWSYEDFFFNEFVPEVERRYNAGGSKEQRAVMGLSMGGGGSVVYCQRHPDLFSSCYAMSAWLDEQGQTLWGLDTDAGKLSHVCVAVHAASPVEFLKKADDNAVEDLKTVKWFFDCGDDDHLVYLSVALHQEMQSHGIKDELRVRDGIHNWEYWHQALRLALPFASRNFSK